LAPTLSNMFCGRRVHPKCRRFPARKHRTAHPVASVAIFAQAWAPAVKVCRYLVFCGAPMPSFWARWWRPRQGDASQQQQEQHGHGEHHVRDAGDEQWSTPEHILNRFPPPRPRLVTPAKQWNKYASLGVPEPKTPARKNHGAVPLPRTPKTPATSTMPGMTPQAILMMTRPHGRPRGSALAAPPPLPPPPPRQSSVHSGSSWPEIPDSSAKSPPSIPRVIAPRFPKRIASPHSWTPPLKKPRSE
jgi:hypothetical protein